MKDYGIVQSTVEPQPLKVDDYSVWVASKITETEDGFEYNLKQYSKDEYIKYLDEQLIATQRAMVDLMGVVL